MDHTSTSGAGTVIDPVILRELDVGRSIRTATNSQESSSGLFDSAVSEPPNHHTCNAVVVVVVVVDVVVAVVLSGRVTNGGVVQNPSVQRMPKVNTDADKDHCQIFR